MKLHYTSRQLVQYDHPMTGNMDWLSRRERIDDVVEQLLDKLSPREVQALLRHHADKLESLV